MAENFRQLQTNAATSRYNDGGSRNPPVSSAEQTQSIDRRTATSSEAHGRSTQGTRYERGDAFSFHPEEGSSTRYFVSEANATEIQTSYDNYQTEDINQELLTVNQNTSNFSISQSSLSDHQPIVYSDLGHSGICLQENRQSVIKRPWVETMDPLEGTSTQSLNEDWRVLEPTIRIRNQNTNKDINHPVQKVPIYNQGNSTKNESLSVGKVDHDFRQVSTANRNPVPLITIGNEEHNLICENRNANSPVPEPENPGYYIPAKDVDPKPVNEDWRLLEPTIRISNQNNTNNDTSHPVQNVPSYAHTISRGNNCLSIGETYPDFYQGATANWSLVPPNPSSRSEEFLNLIYERRKSLTTRHAVETMNNPLEVSLQGPSVNERIPNSLLRGEEPAVHLNAAEQDGHASGVTVRFPIQCEKCGKWFFSHSSYNAHVQNNCDPKPFKCECGSAFRFQSQLKTHCQSTHSTERPFKCDMCPYASKLPGNLKKHYISNHTRK